MIYSALVSPLAEFIIFYYDIQIHATIDRYHNYIIIKLETTTNCLTLAFTCAVL